jgi:ATP-dependent DNA helicase RecG
MKPQDLVSMQFRLIPAQASALRRLGIISIEDLLRHFPARYDTAGTSTSVRELVPGTKVTLYGKLSGLKAKKLWKSRRNATEGFFEDSSGRVKVMWFNQPYMASYVSEGSVVKVTGTVGGSAERPYITNPEVEKVTSEAIISADTGLFRSPEDGGANAPTLYAVYPETAGITSLWIRHAIERLFKNGVQMQVADPIPADIRERYHLPDMATALQYIHTPEKDAHAQAARKRFAFEEIFAIQTARAQERAENDSQASFPIRQAQEQAEKFLASIPFSATVAQEKAIADILGDFTKPHPMARLLEGDVGSGKTLVAAAAAYSVVTSRPPSRESGTLQVAYMAPTEILAGQHFQSFIEYFKDLPINIGLMTGSGCKKFPSKIARRLPAGRQGATDISRSQLLKWIANGEIAMLIGTHALIQKSVTFQHLALAIVDEQHRFGTRQRRALAHKSESGGKDMADFALRNSLRSDSPRSKSAISLPPPVYSAPHFLSMTATPIPRTLALTLYGDLDISILDELPPGRAKITTKIIKPKERAQAYEAVRAELAKGRQAYVICPRIEEPDPAKINAMQARSAKAEAKRLQKDIFPEYEVGLLHGAMTPKEKDAVMKDFAENKLQLLVATSVVEVGINVPNATAIMIEGAERFGLAQLHQLRGRIMRSSHPPYCFLLPESAGEMSSKRLKALEKSDDGFKLAEADLEARGAGDLFGRRQWGMSDLGMEALKNVKLIRAARDEAERIVSIDPELASNSALRARVARAGAELHNE